MPRLHKRGRESISISRCTYVYTLFVFYVSIFHIGVSSLSMDVYIGVNAIEQNSWLIMMTSSNGNTQRYWPFVRGIHQSPVDFLYKGQSRGALMFSLINAWTNNWANKRDAADLRGHHYGVTVMTSSGSWCIGIKGEMSGTVCVTFTWDIYIYLSCL